MGPTKSNFCPNGIEPIILVGPFKLKGSGILHGTKMYCFYFKVVALGSEIAEILGSAVKALKTNSHFDSSRWRSVLTGSRSLGATARPWSCPVSTQTLASGTSSGSRRRPRERPSSLSRPKAPSWLLGR